MNSDDPYRSKPTPLEWTVILTVVFGAFGVMTWIANESRSPQRIWNGLYPYLLSGGAILSIRFLWLRLQKQKISKTKQGFWVSLLPAIVSYWIAKLIQLILDKNTDWDAITLTLGAAVVTAFGAWFRFGFWRWVFITNVGKKRSVNSDSHKK